MYFRVFLWIFFFQSIYTDYAYYTYFDKSSRLNIILWTNLNQILLGGSFPKRVRQPCHPFNTAAVTKIEIHLIVLLLYY